MIEFKGKITEGGKIVIPPEYQQALEAHVGDEVVIRVGDKERDLTLPCILCRGFLVQRAGLPLDPRRYSSRGPRYGFRSS